MATKALRSKDQQKLFKASGSVVINKDKLTCFLYLLMRDHVPPGQVADLMNGIGDDCNYTNGWLAKYAQYTAKTLRGKK